MTWENMTMYMATIPKYKSKNAGDDTTFVSPEDEERELRKTLGL